MRKCNMCKEDSMCAPCRAEAEKTFEKDRHEVYDDVKVKDRRWRERINNSVEAKEWGGVDI